MHNNTGIEGSGHIYDSYTLSPLEGYQETLERSRFIAAGSAPNQAFVWIYAEKPEIIENRSRYILVMTPEGAYFYYPRYQDSDRLTDADFGDIHTIMYQRGSSESERIALGDSLHSIPNADSSTPLLIGEFEDTMTETDFGIFIASTLQNNSGGTPLNVHILVRQDQNRNWIIEDCDIFQGPEESQVS